MVSEKTDSEIIKDLKDRVEFLEEENRLLKKLLTDNGVSYAHIYDKDDEIVKPYVEDQGSLIEWQADEITLEKANNFFMCLCEGRRDVYETRFVYKKGKRKGKAGYSVVCDNFWRDCCQKNKVKAARIANLWRILFLNRKLFENIWQEKKMAQEMNL